MDNLELDKDDENNDDDSGPYFTPPKGYDDDFYIDDGFDSDHLSLKGKKGAKEYRWKKHDYDSDDEEETSFGGGVVKSKNKIIDKIKSRFPGFPKVKGVEYEKLVAESEDGSLGIREKLTDKFTMVINSAGEIATRIPTRLRKFLGESFHEKLQRNRRLNDEAVTQQHRLRDENKKDQISYNQLPDKEMDNMFDITEMGNDIQKRMAERNEESNRLQGGIDERNLEDNNIIKKLPIRERVKQIFKKYGLTVASILLAIWAVVATIIGATQSTAVGDKKQEPGPVSIPLIRINKPIPIDPIINFIYDVALEVIEDLVENSFLLIELLVIFYIDGRR